MLSDRERYELIVEVLATLVQQNRPPYLADCSRLDAQIERLRADYREAFPDTGGGETPGEG
jgi:hypothetical protein